jgi:hypothetical protein
MEDRNRMLLVLVDSRSRGAYADVEHGLLAALVHWGMPYQLHDLAKGQPSTEGLSACAAVVLAQQSLGAVLSDDAARAIAEAVANGIGYVGCDGNVGHMPPPLQHVAGVRVEDVQPVFGAQSVDVEHWVSQWQVRGARYRFKRSLEMSRTVPAMPRVRVLLESDGYPALWVTPYGGGRAVQWALPPGTWRREVFGYCEGLDDLLWRGIVWAAQKPFAMLAMPPFSTSHIENAIGAHDFAWVEALHRHGFPPNVGVFPDDIDALSEIRGQSNFSDRAVDMMRRCVSAGWAEFSPQAATWNRAYLLYCRADGSEIPSDELSQRLSAVDKQFARYGIPWARTVNPHYHQLGYNALSFLKSRGVEFTSSSQLPGETWEGEHKLWPCAPYGHPGFAVAPLPDSADFYAVTSGRSHLHTTEQTGPERYRILDSAYALETDFMWGRTRWHGQCRIDDWDAMAEAAVRQIRLGLNSLFFACPATCEQTIAFVSLEDWTALWQQVSRRVSRWERWPALYSDVAAYARAKHRTRLVGAGFDGTSLACSLRGAPDVPLYLLVWDDLDSAWPACRYQKVEPFVRSERAIIPRL